jgi:hypothetical protein
MKKIFNPDFFGWAAFTYLFYGYSILTINEELVKYGHFLFFIIPSIVFLAYPLIVNILKYTFIPVLFGIAGSASLFLPDGFGFALSLMCVSCALLPVLYSLKSENLWGISLGVLLLFLLQIEDQFSETYVIIFVCLEILYLISLQINKTVSPTPEKYIIVKGKLPVLLLFILISNSSCFFLTWSILPGFIIKEQLPALIVSFFIFSLLIVPLIKKFTAITVNSNIKILFVTSFFSIFFQGLLSKGYGLAFNVYFLIITILFVISTGSVLSLFRIKYGMSEKEILHSLFFHYLTFCIVFLIFLMHIPLCFVWIEKINSLSLPEDTFALSFGQYFLKNITLLSVFSTFMAGLVYLKRRSF